jgi:hypothetical protein
MIFQRQILSFREGWLCLLNMSGKSFLLAPELRWPLVAPVVYALRYFA